MRKVELLSPAGNMEKLKEAFHFGADACYIGGGAFNLRGMSANFRDKELAQAIEYAHSLGKKIYVTLNIFAHNQDINYMPRFIKYLESIKVDGVIVSDLGVFHTVKENAPNLEIHISTQANSINWATVKAWRDLGATRVILAREMTLKEIKEIKEKVPNIEIEVFVHGAMCMAYSGRCLLSNYFTNRDANRGVCAQDCRWNYKVVAQDHENAGAHDIIEDAEGTYIFNAKDLCTIEFIDEIIKAGVDSLKIEGRMKSIYYNSIVTKQYREAIDKYYSGNYSFDEKWLYELQTISHRLYSKGFFFGKTTEEDQNYNTSLSYSQTYQLVANVLENLGNDEYQLYIRNKIIASEVELELIRPNEDPVKFRIDKFFNIKTNEYTDVVNPNTIAVIKTNIKMDEMDLIRVKLPVGYSVTDIDTKDI
ncbi:peptidase U32 family protein [Caviibacter abscessus]|uniref:peptidase U32 family protein n=1 Tax=Caviibacter abscessus TaxID=1766719 RepID=UPI0008334F89|nr:U32 family peptidase [Caviibacter abscessus]